MPPRQRQFSQVRSNANSRSNSLYSSAVSVRQKSEFSYHIAQQKHDCTNCINKKMAVSRRDQQKRKADQQIKEHLENVKLINSMRDHQRQNRQRMLNESTQYNKSLMSSQRQSIKLIKKLDNQFVAQQNQKKQRQLSFEEQKFKRSRKQLQKQYQNELRNQLMSERSKKSLEISRVKQQNPAEVNRLKVIQENERYVRLMKEQRKKCLKQNKKQILQKSLSKYEERQRELQKDLKHIQSVQKQFKSFSQFQSPQSSPYRMSRAVLSFQNNPEDVLARLKRIQTQKALHKVTQRQINHNQRMNELRRQEEQNKLKLKKNLSSMRNYVQDLTKQLLQKRQKQVQQMRYANFYPQKSKVYYFTEELKKQLKPCNSCERLCDSRYLGV